MRKPKSCLFSPIKLHGGKWLLTPANIKGAKSKKLRFMLEGPHPSKSLDMGSSIPRFLLLSQVLSAVTPNFCVTQNKEVLLSFITISHYQLCSHVLSILVTVKFLVPNFLIRTVTVTILMKNKHFRVTACCRKVIIYRKRHIKVQRVHRVQSHYHRLHPTQDS